MGADYLGDANDWTDDDDREGEGHERHERAGPPPPSGELASAESWLTAHGFPGSQTADVSVDEQPTTQIRPQRPIAVRTHPRALASPRAHAAYQHYQHAQHSGRADDPVAMQGWESIPAAGSGYWDACWERFWQAKEHEMASLARLAHPYGATSAPSVWALGRYRPAVVYERQPGGAIVKRVKRGLSFAFSSAVEPHLLAILLPSRGHLWLNQRLLAPDVYEEALRRAMLDYSDPMERVIDESRVLRLIFALALLRWWECETLTALRDGLVPQSLRQNTQMGQITKAQAIGFGPIRQADWQESQGAYYTGLWRMLCDLLTPEFQVAAQAAWVLQTPPERLPRDWDGRLALVDARWRREAYRLPPEQSQTAARLRFVRRLAEMSAAPETLILDRMQAARQPGGSRPIRYVEDYATLSEELLRDLDELRFWRDDTAAGWRVHPQRVALWLMEPYAQMA